MSEVSRHIVVDNRIRRSSTGRYSDRLVEHLQKIDNINHYTILLESGDEWQPSVDNFTALACPYKKFSFNPLDQITFAKFLKNLNPDLVHFTMTPMEPIAYRGKRITTTHDLTMLRFTRAGKLSPLLHWVRMMGYKLLFWHSHKSSKEINVPTEFVAADLAALHPFAKDKIVITYESSEPPIKTKSQKPKLDGLDTPYILHVGSPFPHKNIERLVKAFTVLKESHPDLKLVLAGKIEQYFERLQDDIKHSSVADDILIPGFVSDAELKWLYENASAYVLPSLSEGFGLPGLEAMVHDCPLVSSNATCLPEVYGDAAVYFDPKDYKDMAAKIAEVLDSPTLQESLKRK